MKPQLLLLLSILLISSCSNHHYTAYTIQKGEHFAKPKKVRGTFSNTIEFDVVFDSSAIYQTPDPSDQADINKLLGFSDCGSSHMQNAARFGWRWYKDEIQILPYGYVKGERFWNKEPKMKPIVLYSADIGENIRLRITKEKGIYNF